MGADYNDFLSHVNLVGSNQVELKKQYIKQGRTNTDRIFELKTSQCGIKTKGSKSTNLPLEK